MDRKLSKLAFAFSVTALVVAVLGTTALGSAAGNAVQAAVSSPLKVAGLKSSTATPRRGPRGPRGPRGFRGLRGLQGVQGLQGAKGDKGDKGDTGAAGTPGAAGVLGREVIISAQTPVTTTLTPIEVNCSNGKKVLGGGWSVNPQSDAPKYIPRESSPSGTGDQGWYVSGQSTTGTVNIFVWAICATA